MPISTIPTTAALIITRDARRARPGRTRRRACLRAMTEGKTRSLGGKDIAVLRRSICVHSDTPNAVAIAQPRVARRGWRRISKRP